MDSTVVELKLGHIVWVSVADRFGAADGFGHNSEVVDGSKFATKSKDCPTTSFRSIDFKLDQHRISVFPRTALLVQVKSQIRSNGRKVIVPAQGTE